MRATATSTLPITPHRELRKLDFELVPKLPLLIRHAPLPQQTRHTNSSQFPNARFVSRHHKPPIGRLSAQAARRKIPPRSTSLHRITFQAAPTTTSSSPTAMAELNSGPRPDSASAVLALSPVCNGLCAACRTLFINIDRTRQAKDRKPRTFQETERAAELGCVVCKFVAVSWNHYFSGSACEDGAISFRLQHHRQSHRFNKFNIRTMIGEVRGVVITLQPKIGEVPFSWHSPSSVGIQVLARMLSKY